jgi:hypothetical protein
MVAEEVFVNYYNFNPIWVHNASIYVKKSWYSKNVIVKIPYIVKFIRGWSRSWSRSRNSAERTIFGSATVHPTKISDCRVLDP